MSGPVCSELVTVRQSLPAKFTLLEARPVGFEPTFLITCRLLYVAVLTMKQKRMVVSWR